MPAAKARPAEEASRRVGTPAEAGSGLCGVRRFVAGYGSKESMESSGLSASRTMLAGPRLGQLTNMPEEFRAVPPP